MWHLSDRADPAARVIADRHYSRQKPGTPQFVPLAWQLLPEDMPEPVAPFGAQGVLA